MRAVDSVSFEVHAGEIFGFLGPNGAGKTTTIRMLMGFLNPTAGEARVLGRLPNEPQVRRRIGYLPADLHFDPRHTGNDVFDVLSALTGSARRERRNSLVERFGLDPTRRIGDLSSGNRRKVGVVQAFMHAPDLFVLDEPTGGLDPLLRHEFLELLREVRTEGAAVFLSSHDLSEVERVADRVGILQRGALVAMTRVEELRARSRTELELHLADPVAADAFAGVPGVVEAHVTGNIVHLIAEGSLDAIVKHAAAYTVERLLTRDADLEEIFLEYYRADS